MAYSESRIGRVHVKAQSGWGTVASGFAAADTVECELTYPELVREAITMDDSIQGTFNHARVQSGSKVGSTFSISMPLHGWSATTPSGNPTMHVDALLLSLALGGSALQGYNASALIGGSATGEFTNMDDTTGLPVWEGNAQLVPMSDTKYSIGWVQQVDASGNPDQVHFVNHLGADYSGTVDNQPRSGGAIYGSNTLFMTRGTTTTPLTIQWEGAKASGGNMLVTLYDCIVTSAKITAGPREQPKLEVELIAGNWSTGAGGDPGAYTFDLPQLPVFTGENGARMVINNASDATVATNVSSFEFNIDVETVEVGSHSGDQGIAQYAVTNRTCTVEIVQPVDGALTTRDPGYQPGPIQVDLAGTPGQSMSIAIFAPVLTEIAGVGDSDGLVSQTFSYGAGAYSGDTAGNGTAANTPARVAFL